jgi:ribokinase
MSHSHRTGPIVVLGSVNMDLITRTPRLPQPGETLLGNDFTTVPGGKGANQAIAAARAGGRVVFIGAVGEDEFGSRLRGALVAGNVSVEFLREAPGPSGIASITVDDDAENTIVVVPGANGTITALDVAERDSVRNAGLLVCQLEIPLDVVVGTVRMAAEAGVSVLLNPSPAQALPSDLLSGVTLLVVNEGEAAVIGPASLATVPHVVTTLGAAGAHYRGPNGDLDVEAPKVQAVDTTGAGDAFAGCLAVAWTAGLSPRDALQRACAAGALATTRPGASSSSPSAAEIDRLVAATYLR